MSNLRWQTSGCFSSILNLPALAGSGSVQNIGAAAVAKASPKIFKAGCLTGICIGVGIGSIVYVGYSYCNNKKIGKKVLKAEQKLEEKHTKTRENVSTKAETEEKPCQN